MPASAGGVNLTFGADATPMVNALKLVQAEISKMGPVKSKVVALTDALNSMDKRGVKPVEKAFKDLMTMVEKFSTKGGGGLSKYLKTLRTGFKQYKKEVDVAKIATKQFADAMNLSAKRMQEMGNTLNKANTRVLAVQHGMRKLKDRVKETAAAGSDSGWGKGVWSKEWIKQRLTWFIQLRAAWALWRGIRQAAIDVGAYNEAMYNLQAITRASNQEMEVMTVAIRAAAVATKYFAGELADAAVFMGQAGFSAEEVAGSIGAVAVLASATGSELKVVSDLMTTIIRAWGMQDLPGDALAVANVLAAGVNKSKLTIEKLSIAMNYVGVSAAQFGLTLQETVGWLGILADRGFKASTMATGFRGVLAALSRETKKFRKVLEQVGVDFSEVSLRGNTLETSMQRLADSGIKIYQIYEGLPRRSAAVTAAMLQNTQAYRELREEITGTQDAFEMSAIQMQSIPNQLRQLKSIVQDFSLSITGEGEAFRNMIWGLKEWSKGLLAFFGMMGTITSTIFITLDLIWQELKDIETWVTGRLPDMWENIKKHGPVGAIAREIKGIFEEPDIKVYKLTGVEKLKQRMAAATDEMKDMWVGPKGILTVIETWYSKNAIGELAAKKSAEWVRNQQESVSSLEKKIIDYQKTYRDYEKSLPEGAPSVDEYYKWRGQKEDPKFAAMLGPLKDFDETYTKMRIAENEISIMKGQVKDLTNALADAGVEGYKATTQLTSDFEHAHKTVEEFKKSFMQYMKNKKDSVAIESKLNELYEEKNEILAEEKREVAISQQQRERLKEINKELEIYGRQLYSATQAEVKEAKRLADEFERAQKALESAGKSADKLATRLARTSYTKQISDIRTAYTKQTSGTKAEYRGKISRAKSAAAPDEVEVLRLQVEQSKELINILDTYQESLRSAMIVLMDDVVGGASSLNDAMASTKNNIANLNEKLEETKRKIAEAKTETIEEVNAAEKLEKQRIAISNEILNEYNNLSSINKLQEELLSLDEQRLGLLEEQVGITGELERKSAGLWDQFKRGFRESAEAAGTLREMVYEIGEALQSSAESNLTNFLVDITSIPVEDIQAQKEAIRATEQQLVDLTAEYRNQKLQIKDNAREGKAASESDLQGLRDREQGLRETNQVLAEQKNQLNQLQDPWHNAGEALRKYVILFLEEMQKVIARLLIVIALQKMTTLFGIGNVGDITAGGTATGSGDLMGFSGDIAAKGGVFPSFKGFRKLAAGGMTNGPMIALLGDNKSGKELVIPSENIKKDSVHGYTRNKEEEKGDINIVNVVSPDLMMALLSSSEGQRVVVNTINADVLRRGSTFQTIRGVR